jgi:hypothetical protein
MRLEHGPGKRRQYCKAKYRRECASPTEVSFLLFHAVPYDPLSTALPEEFCVTKRLYTRNILLQRITRSDHLTRHALIRTCEPIKVCRQTPTQEPQQAALAGIRAETEKSVQTVLGDKAWSSYQKQNSAYWLKNISPDPKPAPSPTP